MLGLTALPAQAAPVTVAETVSVPVSVAVAPEGITCDNTGSSLTLGGSLTHDGLSLTTVFKNNVKGTQTLVGESTTGVVGRVDLQDIPKQPVLSGVGGNPYISIGLATRADDTEPWVLVGPTELIGRCVQGVPVSSATLTTSLPIAASAFAQAVECTSKGSRVSVNAAGLMPALAVVVVFDNNINKVVHRKIVVGDTILAITGATAHRGWGTGAGAGGNPLVYLRFHNSSTSFTDFFLGRCKDLL